MGRQKYLIGSTVSTAWTTVQRLGPVQNNDRPQKDQEAQGVVESLYCSIQPEQQRKKEVIVHLASLTVKARCVDPRLVKTSVNSDTKL
jgi:hypothetical protein